MRIKRRCKGERTFLWTCLGNRHETNDSPSPSRRLVSSFLPDRRRHAHTYQLQKWVEFGRGTQPLLFEQRARESLEVTQQIIKQRGSLTPPLFSELSCPTLETYACVKAFTSSIIKNQRGGSTKKQQVVTMMKCQTVVAQAHQSHPPRQPPSAVQTGHLVLH